MFAYAGASTFPTIQADMRDRGKFIYAAILAILSKDRRSNLDQRVFHSHICSSLPHILPCSSRLLLLPGRPSEGQHRAGHVQWVGEGGGGDHAAPPSDHCLPYHH